MGVYFHYANYSKRERFIASALGGGLKRGCLSHTLASRAFHLLLLDEPARASKDVGRWKGDSIAIVGDEILPDWEQFTREFADIEANAILLVLNEDGFEIIGDAAEKDSGLFMELCHLIVTRQAPDLERYMKERFGDSYLRRYKELCGRKPFEPKDIVARPAE
jgi:hypothetical protein